jgi:hypothetical protein
VLVADGLVNFKYISKMVSANLTSLGNTNQRYEVSRPAFSGLRNKRISDDLIRELQKVETAAASGDNPTQIAFALNRYRDLLMTKKVELEKQGTTKWSLFDDLVIFEDKPKYGTGIDGMRFAETGKLFYNSSLQT